MGSFANGLFSLLLGWLQSVVSFLWAALSGNRGSAALSWLYEHWLLLAVLLCVFGGTADLIVYLIRWLFGGRSGARQEARRFGGGNAAGRVPSGKR